MIQSHALNCMDIGRRSANPYGKLTGYFWVRVSRSVSAIISDRINGNLATESNFGERRDHFVEGLPAILN
jgi:hypothetical protein